MKSDLPKVLHRIGGRPLVHYVLDCAVKAGLSRIVVVVGHQKEKVVEALSGYRVEFAEQLEQNGTGHAVQIGLRAVRERDGLAVVLSGDAPFLRVSTLKSLIREHVAAGVDCTVLTAVVPEPDGYGRIVRDASGAIAAIVEDADCKGDEKRICEVNSAIYCFRLASLISCAELLTEDNVQGELYLTDVVRIMHSRGMKLGTFAAPDWREILGINTVAQLEQGESILEELREDT